MGKRLTAVFVVAAVLFFSQNLFAARNYNAALRQYTHSGSLYNFETWDANLIWYATFMSDEMRQEYEKKHIEKMYLDDEEAAAFTAEQERRQARYWDFFVSFYTKKELKQFSDDPDSFWKVVLTTEDGTEVKPESIEMVPVTPYVKAMYPHFNRWSKAYRVTFPKVNLGDNFSLSLMSVVGKSTITWKPDLHRSKKMK